MDIARYVTMNDIHLLRQLVFVSALYQLMADETGYANVPKVQLLCSQIPQFMMAQPYLPPTTSTNLQSCCHRPPKFATVSTATNMILCLHSRQVASCTSSEFKLMKLKFSDFDKWCNDVLPSCS